MKFESYREYDAEGVALAQRAFLTVWAGLGAWHDDLVLVGGLVPLYICGDVSLPRSLPRPVTLDADLGIALGASRGQYGNLNHDLQAQGFLLTRDKDSGPRFEKTIGRFTIPVDFLVEYPPNTRGAAMVDDIPANILPGINRALETARVSTVEGIDLQGAHQKLAVRVCEAGPFLVMKLRAFGSRQQPKDAFDILYTLKHYDRGTGAAVDAFAEECRVGNPACPEAVVSLARHFESETSPAAVRAAHFVFGHVTTGEPDDVRFQRLQIQQDMVDAGRMLRAAIPLQP